MNEYALVRVVRLLVPPRPVMGSDGLTRQPRVGDVGAIVHILKADTAYVVECSGSLTSTRPSSRSSRTCLSRAPPTHGTM
jgi:hypothetical protein